MADPARNSHHLVCGVCPDPLEIRKVEFLSSWNVTHPHPWRLVMRTTHTTEHAGVARPAEVGEFPFGRLELIVVDWYGASKYARTPR
jgi:hypothetical protein